MGNAPLWGKWPAALPSVPQSSPKSAASSPGSVPAPAAPPVAAAPAAPLIPSVQDNAGEVEEDLPEVSPINSPITSPCSTPRTLDPTMLPDFEELEFSNQPNSNNNSIVITEPAAQEKVTSTTSPSSSSSARSTPVRHGEGETSSSSSSSSLSPAGPKQTAYEQSSARANLAAQAHELLEQYKNRKSAQESSTSPNDRKRKRPADSNPPAAKHSSSSPSYQQQPSSSPSVPPTSGAHQSSNLGVSPSPSASNSQAGAAPAAKKSKSMGGVWPPASTSTSNSPNNNRSPSYSPSAAAPPSGTPAASSARLLAHKNVENPQQQQQQQYQQHLQYQQYQQQLHQQQQQQHQYQQQQQSHHQQQAAAPKPAAPKLPSAPASLRPPEAAAMVIEHTAPATNDHSENAATLAFPEKTNSRVDGMDAEEQHKSADAELAAALSELLSSPMYTAPQHLLCPLSGKTMADPVLAAGDGYTYDRKSIEAWIRQRLPADRTTDDMPVPGPQGDLVALSSLIPSRTARDSINRWRSRRKAIKKLSKKGSETVVARQLRRSLQDLRARELNNFEKAQRMSQIESELGKVHDQVDRLCQVAEEKSVKIAAQELVVSDQDARINEAEEQLRELTRRLEELRATQRVERQKLEALQQDSLATKEETNALQKGSVSLKQSGAALIREREESKTHLDQAWEHSQTCLAQLEEAHNLGAVLQQVINEHPESRSLRQKFDQSNQGLEHIQKEIHELKSAIATELCCRSRVPELEDPYRLEMLQHACSLGSTEAQYRLGKYYLCQDEDPEEEAKALSYFMKVVSSGLDDAGRVKPFMSIQESALVSKALYKVGICHRRGLGTPVDVELAYRYFALAADSGHASAQNMMGNAYNEAGGVFPRDVEMAFKYFEKSSAQGYKMATYNLAILYQSDEIKAKDDRHAFHLFKSLAEGGDEDSMWEVSECYREGKGVAPDAERAEFWRSKRDAAAAAAAAAENSKDKAD